MSELSRKEVIDTLMSASKEIEAASFTEDEFIEYQNFYQKYGINLERWLFNIFDNPKDLDKFLRRQKKTYKNLSEIIDRQTMDRLLKEGCFLIVSAGLNEDESNEVKDWKSQYRNNTAMLKWIDDFVHKEIKSRDDILKKKLESMGCPYYELLGIYGGNPELSYMVDLTNNGKNSKQKIDVLCDSLISFVGRKLIQDAVIGRYGKQESYVYCGKRGLSNMFHNELVKHLEGFGEKGQSEMRHERKIMNPEKDFSRFNNDYDWGRKKPGRGF